MNYIYVIHEIYNHSEDFSLRVFVIIISSNTSITNTTTTTNVHIKSVVNIKIIATSKPINMIISVTDTKILSNYINLINYNAATSINPAKAKWRLANNKRPIIP